MAVSLRSVGLNFAKCSKYLNFARQFDRCLTQMKSPNVRHCTSNTHSNKQENANPSVSLPEYRFVYPEFLPDPLMNRRHSVKEKLERMDMLKRRTIIEIPEFYVGSIMAVIVSDCHAPGKTNRFVGICIQREGHGLRATFTLRNVIDGQGVEIMYDLYNPTIQSIEVLRLEKRLDDDLTYLRDALPEYSTIPFDIEPVHLPEGSAVPINQTKVKLKPPPWTQKWEQRTLHGVQEVIVSAKKMARAQKNAKPWEKYDLMKEYRNLIHEEDQEIIFQDVHEHHQQMSEGRKKIRRKRTIVKPTKTV